MALAGGGLATWAVIGGEDTEDGIGGSIHATYVPLDDFTLTTFGATIGITAGVVGGWVDSLIMRLVDGLLAVPDLLFTLLIVTVLGGGSGHALLAVAVAFTPGMARISRSAVLSVRTREFVQAAVARGEGRLYIIGAEVLS